MMTNYKCTFSLKKSKGTSVMPMPSQREQYRNIVHLFIGTGRSSYKITLMPFTFINNSMVILRGLIWLFIFKCQKSVGVIENGRSWLFSTKNRVVWPLIVDQRLIHLTPHMFPCHRSHSWISGGDHFLVKNP
jgi:hypothetical protein